MTAVDTCSHRIVVKAPGYHACELAFSGPTNLLCSEVLRHVTGRETIATDFLELGARGGGALVFSCDVDSFKGTRRRVGLDFNFARHTDGAKILGTVVVVRKTGAYVDNITDRDVAEILAMMKRWAPSTDRPGPP